jgi:hypothetical protein
LADWALGQVYGQKDAVAHGPLAETFVVKNTEAQVTFKSPGGNLKSSDGEPLRGFELAGKDGIFHPVIAQIGKAGTVHLKSDPVSSPVSVRYGWTAMPDVNLVDAKGFPAFPFQTGENKWYILNRPLFFARYFVLRCSFMPHQRMEAWLLPPSRFRPPFGKASIKRRSRRMCWSTPTIFAGE